MNCINPTTTLFDLSNELANLRARASLLAAALVNTDDETFADLHDALNQQAEDIASGLDSLVRLIDDSELRAAPASAEQSRQEEEPAAVRNIAALASEARARRKSATFEELDKMDISERIAGIDNRMVALGLALRGSDIDPATFAALYGIVSYARSEIFELGREMVVQNRAKRADGVS